MSIAEFYNKFHYPGRVSSYRFGKPDIEGNIFSYSGVIGFDAKAKKTILVVGCGCVEGVVIANTHPNSTVLAMDISETQLRISKSIARNKKIKNIAHFKGDITRPLVGKYDIINACGVLHHIENIHDALTTIYNALNDNGTFVGMVYHKDGRPRIIAKRNKMFLEQKMSPEDVRQWMKTEETNPFAIAWFERHDQSDQEISDTWLHPFFRDYSIAEWKETIQPWFTLSETNIGDPTKLLFKARKSI